MRPSTRVVVLDNRKLWTPAALGLLLTLWLDAADASTITLNGSSVSQWRDKSGNGKHTSQDTPVYQPTYTANAFAGKPGLTFDGFYSFLAGVPVNQIIQLSQYSSFVVGRAQAINTDSPAGFLNAGFYGDVHGFMSMYLRSSGLIGAYNWDGNADSVTLPYTVGTTVIANAELGGGSLWIRVNGGTENSIASGNNTSGISPLNIGNVHGRTSQALNGAVAEVIFTGTALSTDNRQRLEGYLAHKWGLAGNLPSDHPFRFAPPLA